MNHKFRFLVMALIVFSFSAFVQAQDTDPAAIIEAVKAGDANRVQLTELPDLNLSAEVLVYPCTEIEGDTLSYSYEQLNIIDTTSGESTMLAEQLISCGGLGAFGLWVVDWRDNYLYYTDAREGVPDGFAGYWTRTIWRADFETLTVENLGQAQFSPDGQWLLSLSGGMLRLIPLDDAAISEFPVMPEDMVLSSLIWLPDSSGAIYIQADEPFASRESAVTHFDMETMEQNILLQTGE